MQLFSAHRGALARSTAALQTPARSFGAHATRLLLGLEQVQDVPTSTDRKPTGMHRGPGKRQTAPKEAAQYQFIRKWDLQMRETWDELEPFKGLPKPKAQFGNEAAEVIWPYVLLLENVIKVHPYTKSIYVYYSQRQSTPLGKLAAQVAKRVSQAYLIPITFHNSQVYVEAEMLLEYSETPWVVVNCLDGTHKLIPVKPQAGQTVKAGAEEVLDDIVSACNNMGNAVKNPKEVMQVLGERPLQNQYVRVNYQWYGDTPEERMSHLVKWDYEPEEVVPQLRNRTQHVLDWMNYDGQLPTHNSVRVNIHREAARMRKPNISAGPKTFFNSSGSRANARTARFNNSRSPQS
ncbi:hypothetical protein LPMP_352980 [Leishmania panamensis]|uniref:Uncharacterized protein n=4 Tax=Viannia TaxID=37616 RepID=A4HPF7_LEIBR|nr:conserved hypothetical protein [Leishmania braziliensis MHOM/BR/75/M2904]XP_010703235.1 hypothetical protein LPMP_352980 [Leishmania panamensis]KAI5691357.1 hypothetical protein MNV84_08070 [Leishmania braziliensis]AIO02435.1 hypothetical protein LPMP_352980 [Leishmania panamensis]CAJ2481562.1 unnamed protein product [Leishmania braziliensis]CAJ2481957.1 unnamed protein product [Leishmania braziliensis]CAM44065.1 conserved hypothetical protein [Leishmania braziliensis MHOM/BR/75/M2904]